jgi:hypothetical protein
MQLDELCACSMAIDKQLAPMDHFFDSLMTFECDMTALLD